MLKIWPQTFLWKPFMQAKLRKLALMIRKNDFVHLLFNLIFRKLFVFISTTSWKLQNHSLCQKSSCPSAGSSTWRRGRLFMRRFSFKGEYTGLVYIEQIFNNSQHSFLQYYEGNISSNINIHFWYSENQNIVEHEDDIKAKTKCIWCCCKAKSFTNKWIGSVSTAQLYHVHWPISSHNLSLKVLFQSFMITPRYRKHNL